MTLQYALEIKNLTFSWRKDLSPLINIDELAIPFNQSLFIQGKSGSGKSTLLNILSGVLSVDNGTVSLLDQPFSTLKNSKRDQFRSDHIGYIFQQFNLLPYLSVVDNVLLPVKISPVRRENNHRNDPSLLEEAKHWLNELRVPTNLFYEKVSRLSIGQQQRVAAARAMIGSPEIIIADEPTSALDQDNVHNFMDVLVTQCNQLKSSLIFVSHDTQLNNYFDQTYILDNSYTGGSQ